MGEEIRDEGIDWIASWMGNAKGPTHCCEFTRVYEIDGGAEGVEID